MSHAAQLLRKAHAVGVEVRMTPHGLKAYGEQTAIAPLVAELRAHKPELIDFISEAAKTTDRLLMLAMQVCDAWDDGPEAREAMRRDCLDTPLHLRQDLIAHFQSVTTSECPQTGDHTQVGPPAKEPMRVQPNGGQA
ncbi:MAG: hypothetical protein RIS44_1285 [Pseudomonadota bacterium]|jgi:hypothetical protein